jgi:hypothetical protein
MNQGKIVLSRADAITADILSTMIEKEKSAYCCHDYIRRSSVVTDGDRRQLVDWCHNMVDICSFSREAVAIAMNLVDRFLSVPSAFASEALQDQREFQLLVVCSLYIAIKVNERVAFGSDMFSHISGGGYSVEEIECMEKIILYQMSWRINGPTSLQIALHILSLMSVEETLSPDLLSHLLNEVQYHAENAVRDYKLSIERSSTVALAVLFSAFRELPCNLPVQLFTSLLPILKSFDFDPESKMLIAESFIKLEAGSSASRARMP